MHSFRPKTLSLISFHSIKSTITFVHSCISRQLLSLKHLPKLELHHKSIMYISGLAPVPSIEWNLIPVYPKSLELHMRSRKPWYCPSHQRINLYKRTDQLFPILTRYLYNFLWFLSSHPFNISSLDQSFIFYNPINQFFDVIHPKSANHFSFALNQLNIINRDYWLGSITNF